MEKQARKGLRGPWAFLPVGFFLVHAAVLVGADDAPHILWSCHLASLVLAAGILLRRPALSGITVMWLTIGLPSWIVASVSDPDFFKPTSALTHACSLGLAILAVREGGVPRGAWRLATAGIVVIWAVSRIVTPISDNVNFAHGHWSGWGRDSLPYPVWLGLLWTVSATAFAGIERLLRRLRP